MWLDDEAVRVAIGLQLGLEICVSSLKVTVLQHTALIIESSHVTTPTERKQK